jgi:hypothetical protein
MAKRKAKKRYANGTGSNGTIANYMETPADALAENDIMQAKAKYEGESNPWLLGMKAVGNMAMQYGINEGGFNAEGEDGEKFLGNMSDKNGNMLNNILPLLGNAKFAMGGTAGTTDIEAEGDEFVKEPGKMGGTLKGPSHEGGGIDLNVEKGTQIYSDRILVGGKSMAERAAMRQQRLMKMKQKLNDTPADKILADTIDRTAANFHAEETKDLALQEMIGFISGSQSKAMFGLSGKDGLPDLLNMMMYGGTTGKKKYFGGTGVFGTEEEEDNPYRDMFAEMAISPVPYSQAKAKNITPAGQPGATKEAWRNIDFNATPSDATAEQDALPTGFADVLGIAGNAFSSIAPYLNTLKSRAEDTPNINAFKDFGKDGLAKLETAKDYIEGQKDEQLGDINLNKTANIRRGRNSSRSVNTSRALDLANSQQAGEQKSNVYNQFSQQMMQLIQGEAGAEDRQDQMVMQGEATRDMNDRRDKDNFRTQLSANLVDIGTGIQQTGKDLNQAKQQKMMMNILNELSKYGITFTKDGKMVNPANTSTT